MTTHGPHWYDAQYNARAGIPEHPKILQAWFDRSAAARATLQSELDVAYGSDASERLDVFLPDAPARTPAPLCLYIHGGYWRALDKRDHSFFAAPLCAAGAVTVLPNYALAPAVSVEHIVLQMVRATAFVRRHTARWGADPKHIVVAGHSAGGHLATMLLNCDWPALGLPAGLVRAALSLSGLYEIEPLRHAPFLAPDLKLDAAGARKLSPLSMPAPRQGRLVAVVGGDESAEFHRQQAAIAQAWAGRVDAHTAPGCNHMTLLDEIVRPGSLVQRQALSLLGLPAG